MKYESTERALDVAQDKWFLRKDSDNLERDNLREVINAAVAIDEEPIAKSWLEKQWVSFEDSDSLTHLEESLIEFKSGNKAKCVLHIYRGGKRAMVDDDGFHYHEWQRAFPLKALGV